MVKLDLVKGVYLTFVPATTEASCKTDQLYLPFRCRLQIDIKSELRLHALEHLHWAFRQSSPGSVWLLCRCSPLQSMQPENNVL